MSRLHRRRLHQRLHVRFSLHSFSWMPLLHSTPKTRPRSQSPSLVDSTTRSWRSIETKSVPNYSPLRRLCLSNVKQNIFTHKHRDFCRSLFAPPVLLPDAFQTSNVTSAFSSKLARNVASKKLSHSLRRTSDDIGEQTTRIASRTLCFSTDIPTIGVISSRVTKRVVVSSSSSHFLVARR